MTRDEKRRLKRIRRKAKADAAAFLKERKGYKGREEKLAFRIAARERARYRREALEKLSVEERRLAESYNRTFVLRVNRLPLLLAAAVAAAVLVTALLVLL